MNTFLASRSLNYYLFSKHKNGHGIHSPFVYSLIRNVFKNKTDSSVVSMVGSLRKKLRSDKTIIEVNDLGSGSLKINSRERRVADIARYASIRPKYGRLLSGLASMVDGSDIIELGTSLGLGTLYLALGAPGSSVITVEGCQNTAGLAAQNFADYGSGNIDLRTGSFDDVFEGILKESSKPGLIYIDGNHRSAALIRYIRLLEPYINEESVVILDDIHYSRDMEKGWDIVRGMDFVTVSIDLLQLGLLFFKKGIKKQDFVIRY